MSFPDEKKVCRRCQKPYWQLGYDTVTASYVLCPSCLHDLWFGNDAGPDDNRCARLAVGLDFPCEDEGQEIGGEG